MPPKAKGGELGRSLMRKAKQDKAARRKESAGTGFGVADIKSSTNALRSVTQVSSLEEFVANAVLSDRQFVAERAANFTLVGADGKTHADSMRSDDGKVLPLRIPRRPKWNPSMSKEQLESNETRSFLEWRAAIARLEEDERSLKVTPFEKNLEVWKQLWRVVERSDILIQIVDARNPLLFRCPDLEVYVKEVDAKKQLLILVNKSDFLTEEFRLAWGKYFHSQGLPFLFFSAKVEQEKIDAMERAMHVGDGLLSSQLDAVLEGGGDETVAPAHAPASTDTPATAAATVPTAVTATDGDDGDAVDEGDDEGDGEESVSSVADVEDAELVSMCRVIGREELIDFLVAKQLELVPDPMEGRDDDEAELNDDGDADDEKDDDEDDEGDEDEEVLSEDMPMARRSLVVGMVGYPNVGKSSTINALMGASTLAHGVKRVSVGNTPGKTKHFQTLVLCPQVTLCDCPGLVFPSFVTSTAELVVNGVLPIAHLRDHVDPMRLVCQRVPRQVLADTYGLKPLEGSTLLYAPPSAFLDVFCHARGFMGSYHAGYDHARGARVILMDYMNGKLLYCLPPPTAPHLNIYSDIIEAAIEENAAAMGLAHGDEAVFDEVDGTAAGAGGAGGTEFGSRKAAVASFKLNAANVLAVEAPDSAALFPIPLPKPKSQRVSVMTQRRRARKGERDADPYGTQTTADPVSQFVAEEAQLFKSGGAGGGKTGSSKARGEDDGVELIGKGHGRANASTFTRVHRPYSATKK